MRGRAGNNAQLSAELQGFDAHETQPLDEDEQLRVVQEIQQEGNQLDWTARFVGAVVSLCVFGMVFFCATCLLIRSPRGPGEPYEYELPHQTLLLEAASFRRLVVAYGATCFVLATSTLVCLGLAGKRLRRTAMGVALVPGALWVRPLRAVAAPLPLYWIAVAAPIGLGFSLYLDADMQHLALDITNLDSLRYKYKGV